MRKFVLYLTTIVLSISVGSAATWLVVTAFRAFT